MHEASPEELPSLQHAHRRAQHRWLASCFWTAYQQCRDATMSEMDTVVDAWSTSTYTTMWYQHRCDISVATEGTNGSRLPGPSIVNNSYLCTRLSREDDSLHVSNCTWSADFFTPWPTTSSEKRGGSDTSWWREMASVATA